MLFVLQVLWPRSNQFFFFKEVNVGGKKTRKAWMVTKECIRLQSQVHQKGKQALVPLFPWGCHRLACPSSHFSSGLQVRPVAYDWHVSFLPHFEAFVPTLSLLQCPSKGLEKYLAGLPNHAGTRILSGHLRPLLPRHTRDNSYPHHAMLDKGALEVVLTPRTWLELGFRIPPSPPPTALIRISAVLLLPGIWPQTSARVQGAFSGNHTNIETFCFRLQLSLPPPGLLVWQTQILSPETGNSGSAWLTLLKLRS